MKAAVRRRNRLVIDDVAAPLPGAGEVLVKTLACGICGSDLHMHHHCDEVLPMMKRVSPAAAFFEPTRDVIFGHEFCAEILDYGPHTRRDIKVGKRVCALPTVVSQDGVGTVGYLNSHPGGFGELMVLQEPTLIEVPGDLPSELAALTEPLSVATHAINKANLSGGEAALIIGCGPIGLAIILALKARGVGPVIAADFSAARRTLAESIGADIVVDPAKQSPYKSWFEAAAPSGYDPLSIAALIGLGPQPSPCVIFECVGTPGVLNTIFAGAPIRSRIVVVGVCMSTDRFEPFIGISKELNVQFSYAYTHAEFSSTLSQLADGTLQADALITGTITLDEVPGIFAELGKADRHAKVVIKYASDYSTEKS